MYLNRGIIIITERWKPEDKDFLDTRVLYFEEKQQGLYCAMRTAVVKQHFFAEVKG